MSIITSFRLWKSMQSSFSKTNQCSHISNSNASENKKQDGDKENIISITNIDIQNVTTNTKVNGDISMIRNPVKLNSSQICTHCKNSTMTNNKKHSYSSTDDNKMSANQGKKNISQVRKTVQGKSESSSSKTNNFSYKENIAEIVDLKHYSNRNPFTTSTDDGRSFDASRQLKKSWEIRAFLTTIIIAFQTITLTGPFIASIEAFSNAPLTLQFRLLLFIPNLINSISNPFIYAWRIPEIRHEFKKLFRINN